MSRLVLDFKSGGYVKSNMVPRGRVARVRIRSKYQQALLTQIPGLRLWRR